MTEWSSSSHSILYPPEPLFAPLDHNNIRICTTIIQLCAIVPSFHNFAPAFHYFALPDSSLPQCRHPLRHGTPGKNLRRSAPASNDPHPAEKSTPVWLAFLRTWAGFSNSQHRDAAFATPDNICAHSSLLPHWAAAQTDANLSAHLHRLPTPPPYLRQMRLLPGRDAGVGWQMLLLVVRGAVPANHRAHESLF